MSDNAMGPVRVATHLLIKELDMFARSAVILSAATLSFTALSHGQALTVTGQNRRIEGTTVNYTDGFKFTNGPIVSEAPAGWYDTWNNTIAVPGNMTVGGVQESWFDGDAAIVINLFTMNFSGGGGPGTSGTGTLTNTISYTFNVNQHGSYYLSGMFGCGPFVTVSFSLTGPSLNIFRDTGSGNVEFNQEVGDIAPGEYTLTLHGEGQVSYEGPGGNGSGAGGNQPIIAFIVTPGENPCPADFNADGSVNSQDFFDFLTPFFASEPRADFNGDGNVNSQDFFDFLPAFFAGC